MRLAAFTKSLIHRFYFNPRTHKECDSVKVRSVVGITLFQSTHSQRVRPDRTIQRLRNSVISIHALTKSATAQNLALTKAVKISIHALTKSATNYARSNVWVYFHFNPRTHKECDFTSLFKRTASNNISIHALTKSATIWHSAHCIQYSSFQSTHSQRVRLFLC